MSIKVHGMGSSRETPVDALIQCSFDSEVLQAEFEALTTNENRLDFIRGIEEIAKLKHESTLSHDEVIAALGLG